MQPEKQIPHLPAAHSHRARDLAEVCMSNKALDIAGQRFGRLTVLERVSAVGAHSTKWSCACDCGRTTVASGSHLKNAITQSCGCWREELRGKSSITHGAAGTPLHASWVNMRARCKHGRGYAGRISVCSEWEDFTAFREWALSSGYVDGLSIDRIDGSGNYCPGNVQWVSRRDNARRTSRNKLTPALVLKLRARLAQASVLQVAHEFGVHIDTVYSIRSGKSWADVHA